MMGVLGVRIMGPEDRDPEQPLDAVLEQLAKGGALDERVGDALLKLTENASATKISPEVERRAVEAANRGAFDGRVALARTRMRGTLGAFASAVRRIREAAGASIDEMADRAGLSASIWQEIEGQQRSPETLSAAVLASVMEAVQMRSSELRDTLARTQKLRLVHGGHAAFRAEEIESSDTAAAYEDLVAASADEAKGDAGVTAGVRNLVDAVEAELRRRGRGDLL